MLIEAGKYYRSRDGRKIGPMRRCDGSHPWCGPASDGLGVTYYRGENGSFYSNDTESNHDLVAEWLDSPVRARTIIEIVPGVYSDVHVDSGLAPNAAAIHYHEARATASDLRAAAAVFVQLAEALESGGSFP